MSTRTLRSSSSKRPPLPSLSLAPPSSKKKAKRAAAAAAAVDAPPKAEMDCQQITRPDFVRRYRVEGLEGGEAYYIADFVDEQTAKEWYDEAVGWDTWYRPTLRVYGKDVTQSRQIAAYATDSSISLTYSGQTVQMHAPFPPLLQRVAERLRDVVDAEVEFNHCMANFYPDGDTYIGRHADSFGNEIIASVSLGAPRTFVFTPHTSKASTSVYPEGSRAPKRWVLANGSLVVMQGETQRFWKHEIPKEKAVKEGRVSLTFRRLVERGR